MRSRRQRGRRRKGAGVGGEVAGSTWGELEWHEGSDISIGQSDQPDRH